MAGLLAVAPIHPDFSFCDAFYGPGVFGQLDAADCIAAEGQMPRGAAPVTWYSSTLNEDDDDPFEIPKLYLEGKKSTIIPASHSALEANVRIQELAKSRLSQCIHDCTRTTFPMRSHQMPFGEWRDG